MREGRPRCCNQGNICVRVNKDPFSPYFRSIVCDFLYSSYSLLFLFLTGIPVSLSHLLMVEALLSPFSLTKISSSCRCFLAIPHLYHGISSGYVINSLGQGEKKRKLRTVNVRRRYYACTLIVLLEVSLRLTVFLICCGMGRANLTTSLSC